MMMPVYMSRMIMTRRGIGDVGAQGVIQAIESRLTDAAEKRRVLCAGRDCIAATAG